MDDSVEWDTRYSRAGRVWSGRPNGSLVAEIAGLEPGRALDVGCGEGADAVWLARQGWQVTALDVSQVAIERGRRAAAAAGVEIEWVHASLAEAGLEAGSFDLVSALPGAPPDSGQRRGARAARGGRGGLGRTGAGAASARRARERRRQPPLA
jgi:SAM-dependent methyltransferase